MTGAELRSWGLAIRPRTLWASAAPVVIGTAMAFGDHLGDLSVAAEALGVALFFQVGANLANDYYDALSGVDSSGRKGPVRVTQAGLLTPAAVRRAFIACFFVGLALAGLLMLRVGPAAGVIGLAAALAAFLYSAGPVPLSHRGLGDVFAFVFFGPVAVAGTYYVQALEWNAAVLAAGLAPGFLAAAILTVNNLRDVETDGRAGKRTWAVCFGRAFAKGEYLMCLFGAAAGPVVVQLVTDAGPLLLIASLAVVFLVPAVHIVYCQDNDGPAMNRVLARTGLVMFAQALIFGLAWII